MNGLFTFWRSMDFSFITLQQSHDVAIRSMVSVASASFAHLPLDSFSHLVLLVPLPPPTEWFVGAFQVWTKDDQFMVSADEDGYIKYWQHSMNNVQAFRAHKQSIRDITFCPSDMKFASGSSDQTINVWDFELCKVEQTLKGHGFDVKTVQWHPSKALLLSGSKDNNIKMWDPKSGSDVCTIRGSTSKE